MLSWISKLKVELASLLSGKEFQYNQIEVRGKLTCIRDGFVGNLLDGLKWDEYATWTTDMTWLRSGVLDGVCSLSRHTFRNDGPIPDKLLVPGR